MKALTTLATLIACLWISGSASAEVITAACGAPVGFQYRSMPGTSGVPAQEADKDVGVRLSFSWNSADPAVGTITYRSPPSLGGTVFSDTLSVVPASGGNFITFFMFAGEVFSAYSIFPDSGLMVESTHSTSYPSTDKSVVGSIEHTRCKISRG